MESKHVEVSCESVLPPLSPEQPWFVAQNLEDEADDTQVDIFYNIQDPVSHYRCQIPELHGKRIRGCFHGCWAVLSSNHPRDVIWSLWNPITSEIINLPPLNHIGSEGDCGDISEFCLSAPPEDPNSVLLLMRTAKPNFVHCRLGIDSSSPEACNRQELRWTESTYANQIKTLTDCDGSLHCLTCCNGKVFAYIRLAGNGRRPRLIVEVNIVINDCEIKKQREVVITLLPMLEFVCPFIVDCPLILPLLKGSSTELFLVVLGLKDKGKTVGAVILLKLNMNNMAWEEIEDLKDTILSMELDIDSSSFYSPAIASSDFGGYIHILADKGKIIYSYHVKDKTICFSCIPFCAGRTNHVSAWTMLECTRLGVGCMHVDCKQKIKGHKEIAVRSVKGKHEVESRQLSFPNGVLKMNCVGVESLKLSPLRNAGYERRLESDKVDDDGSHLLNLPPHVLEMLIREFCAGVEYLKFRATSKHCHLAAPLIPWNNGKASKIMQKYSVPSPWLIVFDKHKGIITLTDPVFGDKYCIKTPQELICDFQIKCSRFGWLLILKPGGSLMFFNPFTTDILELPELPNTYKICFSAPPTSPDCMVVGIAVGCPAPCHVCIHIVGGEPSWRITSLDVWGDKFFKYLTFYGRDLYALREDGGFDVFREMGREDHAWSRDAAKAPASCCKSLPQRFQLICDQHLLRVIVGKFGESVEVFRKPLSRNWEKIDTLGKHVIFICGDSSVCLDAKTPQMENKIYFPTSPIMYYSLETCRFHTLNNEDSFGDFFGTKHHLSPHGWIEPRWS